MIKTKNFFYAAILLLFSAASRVFADSLVPCGGPGQPACTICHFFLLTQQALRYTLVIVPIAAALVLVACGFSLMINRGNPGATSKTRFVMLTVIAGLLMVFGGWVAVNSYFASAGVAKWNGYSLTHDWWTIDAKCTALKNEPDYCGDGVVTGEEQCDPEESVAACQGRTGFTEERCQIIKNKCSADCTVEYCGDSVVQAGEQCDNGNKNGEICSAEYKKTCTYCTKDCKIQSVVGSSCGDGIFQSPEECDKGSQNGVECTADYGKTCTYCTKECKRKFVTGPYCGDGTVQDKEECDAGDKNDVACTAASGKTCTYCTNECKKKTVTGATVDDTTVTEKCTVNNKDKVGLGCWPGWDTVLGDIKKQVTKDVDAEIKKEVDDYIKMMTDAGQKMTDQEIADLKNNTRRRGTPRSKRNWSKKPTK